MGGCQDRIKRQLAVIYVLVILLMVVGVSECRGQLVKIEGGWLIEKEGDLREIEYWGRKSRVCDTMMGAIKAEVGVLVESIRKRDSVSIGMQKRLRDVGLLVGGLGHDLSMSMEREKREIESRKRLEADLKRERRGRKWDRVVYGAGGIFLGIIVGGVLIQL